MEDGDRKDQEKQEFFQVEKIVDCKTVKQKKGNLY